MSESNRDRMGPKERRRLQAARLVSIRRAIPTDGEIAELLGLETSAVEAWGRGEVLAREEHERLVALDLVVEMLTGVLEPSSIRKWLLGLNAHLSERRPVDLLRRRQIAPVLAAIETQISGGFA